MSTSANTYLLECIKSFKGLKSTAEAALRQLNEAELHQQPNATTNSVAVLMQHLSGNMRSRFTDFLTSDGEKPDRNREAEFIDSYSPGNALWEEWNYAWQCLLDTLDSLTPEDLQRTVRIKGEEQNVIRAIQRQLVHYAYHTGQLIYICKIIRGMDFISPAPSGK